jgi:hypothetical protein
MKTLSYFKLIILLLFLGLSLPLFSQNPVNPLIDEPKHDLPKDYPPAGKSNDSKNTLDPHAPSMFAPDPAPASKNLTPSMVPSREIMKPKQDASKYIIEPPAAHPSSEKSEPAQKSNVKYPDGKDKVMGKLPDFTEDEKSSPKSTKSSGEHTAPGELDKVSDGDAAKSAPQYDKVPEGSQQHSSSPSHYQALPNPADKTHDEVQQNKSQYGPIVPDPETKSKTGEAASPAPKYDKVPGGPAQPGSSSPSHYQPLPKIADKSYDKVPDGEAKPAGKTYDKVPDGEAKPAGKTYDKVPEGGAKQSHGTGQYQPLPVRQSTERNVETKEKPKFKTEPASPTQLPVTAKPEKANTEPMKKKK